MKPSFFILLAICLSAPMSAKAEYIEFTDPSWQEVPGTLAPDAVEPYNSHAYIDVDSIDRDGTIITYSVMDPNSDTMGTWKRTATPTSSGQYRRVIFRQILASVTLIRIDIWSDATEPYHQALLSFVCGL